MAILRYLLSLILACVVLGAPSAWAQAAQTAGPTFPALTGRVVDQANIIPADVEAQLTTQLAALEAKSSDQLVVVTVSSLQGYEIEEYGYRLGRAWQIGQGERLNNGVLLLVAPDERKVRIEVGYGLEGVLTDMFTGQIIRNDILPAFKAGDMPAGIVAGVNGIEGLLVLDPAELQARADRGLKQLPSGGSDERIEPGVLIFLALFIGFWIWIATMSMRKTRFKRRGGWNGAASDVHDWDNAHVAANVASVVLQILLSGGGRGGGDGGGGGGGFSGGGGGFGGGGSSGSW